MNLKRGFYRIFLVIAILWLVPVIVLTVFLIPPNPDEAVLFIPPSQEPKRTIKPGERKTYTLTDLVSETVFDIDTEFLTEREIEYIFQLAKDNNIDYNMAEKCYNLQKQIYAKDPNLILEPPSFWKSEEGLKFLKQTNHKILLKHNIMIITYYTSLFVLIGFFLWAIPLALVYLIGLLIWWMAIGFR